MLRCFRVADRGTLAALPQSCYQLSLPAKGDLETASATNVGRRRRTVSSDPSAEVQERALRNDEDLDAYFLAFPEQAVYRYSGGSTPSSSHVVVNFGTGQNTTLGETIGLAGPVLDVLVSLCFRGKVGRGRPALTLFFKTSTTAAPIPRQRIEYVLWFRAGCRASADAPGVKGSSPGLVQSLMSEGLHRRCAENINSWIITRRKWTYTWKTWSLPKFATSAHFFHAWQILRRDATGGPVVTLDYKGKSPSSFTSLLFFLFFVLNFASLLQRVWL